MMTRLISDYLSRLTALPQSIVSLRIKQPVLIESGDRIPYTVDIKGTSNMKLHLYLKMRLMVGHQSLQSMKTVHSIRFRLLTLLPKQKMALHIIPAEQMVPLITLFM